MPLEPPEDEGVDPLAGEGEIAGEKEAGEEQVSSSQAEPAEQRQSPSLEEKIEEMDEAIADAQKSGRGSTGGRRKPLKNEQTKLCPELKNLTNIFYGVVIY